MPVAQSQRRITPRSPRELIGLPDTNIVTPAATAALGDAFRQGFVTTDDIIERVGERAKAKKELDLVTTKQQLAEANDPQLVQAKRSGQLLAGEQAQQARDLLPLARKATEEKLFADIRSGQIQKYQLKEKLEALNNFGFAPAPDPEKGITPEFANEVNKNFSLLASWQKDKANANFDLANIKQGERQTLTQGTWAGPTDVLTGAAVDPKRVDELRNRANKTLPEFLRDMRPGEAAITAPDSVVTPSESSQAPVQAAPEALVTPREAPTGFVQVKPPVLPAENVKRTDALQRDLLQLDNVQDSITLARKLAVPGVVGPGQVGVTRGMHQLLAAFGSDKAAQTYTNQDQLNTVIANEIAEYVRDWKGAISDKELRFFQSARPRIDSTPERWAEYLTEWESKNEKLKKILLGELPPDDPAVWATNPKAQAAQPGAVSPAAPATPPPKTPSEVPVVKNTADPAYLNLPSGAPFKDLNGNFRLKP